MQPNPKFECMHLCKQQVEVMYRRLYAWRELRLCIAPSNRLARKSLSLCDLASLHHDCNIFSFSDAVVFQFSLLYSLLSFIFTTIHIRPIEATFSLFSLLKLCSTVKFFRCLCISLFRLVIKGATQVWYANNFQFYKSPYRSVLTWVFMATLNKLNIQFYLKIFSHIYLTIWNRNVIVECPLSSFVLTFCFFFKLKNWRSNFPLTAFHSLLRGEIIY